MSHNTSVSGAAVHPSCQTAEAVCQGHPDKLCDLIADSILDACLRADRASRVACEVMITKGRVVVAGEITCAKRVDVKFIVRRVLEKVGYKPWRYRVSVYLHRQSEDIAAGVDKAIEARGSHANSTTAKVVSGSSDPYDLTGAGDQGTVYGYATNENSAMLPAPLVYAQRICKRLDSCRKGLIIKGIQPDGKAQVTVEYHGGQPVRVKTVVVSIQHDAKVSQETLEQAIRLHVLAPVFADFPLDESTEILINPSGRFVLGGPDADTGLTGRKLGVDTYGGIGGQAGGALCGKDPTKVDRAGAYMARYIAKNVVWAGLAEKCEVALSYAIGKARPVMVSVRGFGTSALPDDSLTRIVRRVFDMRPAAIIDHLDLRNVCYTETSSYGHFGNLLMPWEDVDMLDVLREAARDVIETGIPNDTGGIDS
jgi:S-adenosylmethionine synthetase